MRSHHFRIVSNCQAQRLKDTINALARIKALEMSFTSCERIRYIKRKADIDLYMKTCRPCANSSMLIFFHIETEAVARQKTNVRKTIFASVSNVIFDAISVKNAANTINKPSAATLTFLDILNSISALKLRPPKINKRL